MSNHSTCLSLVSRAQLCLGQNQLQRSLNYCYQAILIDPCCADSYFILASVLEKKGLSKPVSRAYERAKHYSCLTTGSSLDRSKALEGSDEERDLQHAVVNCLMELQSNPHNTEIKSKLDGLIAQQIQPKNQLFQCQRQVQLQPKSAKARLELGNALVRNGELEAADKAYRCAIKLQPNFAEAYWELGKLLQQQDKLREALPLQSKALELQPNLKGEVLYNQANQLAKGGKLDEAISCYQQALSLQPNLAGAYWHLGKAFQRKGKIEEARICRQKAISIDPEFVNSDIYVSLVQSVIMQKRTQEVVSNCNSVIHADARVDTLLSKIQSS